MRQKDKIIHKKNYNSLIKYSQKEIIAKSEEKEHSLKLFKSKTQLHSSDFTCSIFHLHFTKSTTVQKLCYNKIRF